MKKTILVMLVGVALASVSVLASADTVLMMDEHNGLFMCSKDTLANAEKCAEKICMNSSKQESCRIAHFSNPNSGGYGAVYQNPISNIFYYTSGFNNEKNASNTAMKNCIKDRKDTSIKCKEVGTWYDGNPG